MSITALSSLGEISDEFILIPYVEINTKVMIAPTSLMLNKS